MGEKEAKHHENKRERNCETRTRSTFQAKKEMENNDLSDLDV